MHGPPLALTKHVFLTLKLADLKKFELEVDEALVRAAENLAQLEHIQEVKRQWSLFIFILIFTCICFNDIET